MGERLSHEHLHRGNYVSGYLKEEYLDETGAICDELAHHYAHHGLKDPEGYFDSADEEVQMILNQGYDTDLVRDPGGDERVREAYCLVRSAKTNFKAFNANNLSQDRGSIERVSYPGDPEEEVFLGYLLVDKSGNKRQIQAPRRGDWLGCRQSLEKVMTLQMLKWPRV